ncbi:MAG: hypothetical protein ACOYL6_13710 [Bacteriovoracaceae bacterium]
MMKFILTFSLFLFSTFSFSNEVNPCAQEKKKVTTHTKKATNRHHFSKNEKETLAKIKLEILKIKNIDTLREQSISILHSLAEGKNIDQDIDKAFKGPPCIVLRP